MKLERITDKFVRVELSDTLSIWFSYDTPIAIRSRFTSGAVIVRPNIWGNTTGSHMRRLGSKVIRVSHDAFNHALAQSLPPQIDPPPPDDPTAADYLAAGWTVTPRMLYDEEGIEGWEWTAPNGRTYCEIGDHNGPPPLPEGMSPDDDPKPRKVWVSEDKSYE